MTEKQKAFLSEFAALLRKYNIDELDGRSGLPARLEFESNGEVLRIMRYKDGKFSVETTSNYSAEL